MHMIVSLFLMLIFFELILVYEKVGRRRLFWSCTFICHSINISNSIRNNYNYNSNISIFHLAHININCIVFIVTTNTTTAATATATKAKA